MNSSLEPKVVLGQIVEQVAKAMGAKGCFIRLLDRSGTILKPDAYYGLSERYAAKGPVEVAKSKLDQTVLEGNSIYIADVRSDSRFQYPQQASRITSYNVCYTKLLRPSLTCAKTRSGSNVNVSWNGAKKRK